MQVRTNIGLGDALIPSSLKYFIYLANMGGIGPCEAIQIIFGNHIKSISIKFGVNRTLHMP